MTRLAAETSKPILMWSYTLPAPRSVEILSEAGYPLYTSIQTCARTLRAMADYRALRERFLRPIEATSAFAPDKSGTRAALAAADAALCEWEARPILARYGIGTNAVGTLASSADAAVAAAEAIGGAVALKVQSPDILHKTEAGAVALNLASPEAVCAAYRPSARQRPSPRSPCTHPRRARAAHGAPRPRGDPGHQARCHLRADADGGPRRRAGRDPQRRGAVTGDAGSQRGTRAARPPQGRSPARCPPRTTCCRRRRARRADGAALAFRRRSRRRDCRDRSQPRARARER